MGVACCTKATRENLDTELRISSTGKTAPSSKSLMSSSIPGRSKTATKKEAKRYNIPKATSDAILITPSQFVVENQGVISSSYQFKKQLGQGSYGSVYEAVHKKTRERRAIKLINRSLIGRSKEGELLSEIKVLKEMDHPNIMKIYEFASDKNSYYIVQEYISGGELFDEIVKRRYFNEQDAAYVVRQLLSAVTYCHSKGVVHRDLKPENILIDSILGNGQIRIKVIDFGTALFLSPNENISETLGTPYYIAPEVINGEYNEKCDVWSIGVIMFILLSGSPPFNGENDDEILESVKKGNYLLQGKAWESISRNAKDLLRKMLTYDPKKRISAADAYQHEWFEGKEKNTLQPEKVRELVSNISHFYSIGKLQQAAMMFITTQLMTRKEKENLTAIFLSLDKNGDGALTREELTEGYTKLYGDSERARIEVESIMAVADVDNNGTIDYSEFLLAMGNKKKLISKANIRQAFDAFDIDKSGSISANEIKKVLGLEKNFSEEVWRNMIEQIDSNNDGEISFKEFENMMNKLIKCLNASREVLISFY
eukprot:TRINITY_DN6763_c0_g1_i6.p1 TRINITY_DN6763_c0_g1~~TRINITY_DN6763_c0_g1_i6.p1  ORF type:complete len:573 (+),score=137.58 TRINITY_DN6763_c0_g1_i6:94-1719(+)